MSNTIARYTWIAPVMILGISNLDTFAADSGRRKPGPDSSSNKASEQVSSSQSAPDYSGSRGKVGVGFATGNFGGSSTALSGWFDLTTMQSIQTVATIGGVNPFQFGFGAVFRNTLVGNHQQGFHVGGGFNLGTFATGNATQPTRFYTDVFPEFGVHVTIPGTNVMASFDGGAVFQVYGGQFEFSLASLSRALGLSVHYFF
jgi:hypothetical protein